MRDRKKVYTILFAFLIGLNGAVCQRIGIPFVQSYPKESYGFGTQNWDIDQADNGVMYLANNEGLLSFDGNSWKNYPLPNKTIVRSILIHNNAIYVGGQNEFGIFRYDSLTRWKFKSLKSIIPLEHRSFEDVWNIVDHKDGIYFQASEKLYRLGKDTIEVIDTRPILYFGKADSTLLAQSTEGILYELMEGKLKMVANGKILRGTEIKDIIKFRGNILIATLKHGLFIYDGISVQPWELPFQDHLKNNYVNSVANLDDERLVIATGFDGVMVVDKVGTPQYNITTEDGLPNNRVICSFIDLNTNLWLGLDNGACMIRTNSPFSRLYPDGESEGAGYDIKVFKDKIYFATARGLYYADWSLPFSNDFKFVKNSNGQVWGLDIVADRLIMNHKDGSFIIPDTVARHIYDESGAWLAKEVPNERGTLLLGTYKGISFLDDQNFTLKSAIPSFSESSRFVEQDQYGNYWVAHPYKGVYYISTSDNNEKSVMKFLGKSHGLPSNLHNHVFSINNQLLVCSESGVYTYHHQNEKFEAYQQFNELLDPHVKVRRLVEAQNNDIWFVTDDDLGYLDFTEIGVERSYIKRSFPEFKKLMNGGWEKIYAIGEDVFITTTNGFLHYNHTISESSYDFNVLIEEINIGKGGKLFPAGGIDALSLGPDENDLQFLVQATEFGNNDELQFQYYLEGHDDDWSVPTKARIKEYTKLGYSDYEFKVRAVNNMGHHSPIETLDISISRPWYLSYLAIGIYLLAIVGGLLYLIQKLNNRHMRLKKTLDTTMEQSKEQISRIKREKMQLELDHRRRELISTTMNLVHKNNIMNTISDDLQKVQKKIKVDHINKEIYRIRRVLEIEDNADANWSKIMLHFNELHKDFFDRLQSTYPELTPKDLKMCAYLKMNLNTKEIASLMNISVRGVEASRYRLRKKLGLKAEANLTRYFVEY